MNIFKTLDLTNNAEYYTWRETYLCSNLVGAWNRSGVTRLETFVLTNNDYCLAIL
jgi:hypothetical protein